MSPDHLSTTFAALADPTRRAILARLGSDEISVTELAAPFDMTTPAITKHLKVLERAGLITRSRQAQWRPCKLNANPLHEVVDYLEHYRQFWEQSFDRLEAHLKTLPTPKIHQTKEKKNGRKKR
jgi:DNA-binding transcriptional ArsR family regulator